MWLNADRKGNLIVSIGGVKTGVEPALAVDFGDRVAWGTRRMSWPQNELV